jgi:hypothetical protein
MSTIVSIAMERDFSDDDQEKIGHLIMGALPPDEYGNMSISIGDEEEIDSNGTQNLEILEKVKAMLEKTTPTSFIPISGINKEQNN